MTPTEPKTGTHTAEQFTCHDCGFIWLKGQHGGHDCKARILVRLERVKSARDHAEMELTTLRDALAKVREALKDVCDQLDCPCRNTTRSTRPDGSVIISSDVRQALRAALALISPEERSES